MDKAARVKTITEYEFLKSQLLDRADRPLVDAYALTFAIIVMDEKHRETFLDQIKSEVAGWNSLTREISATEERS